MVVKILIYNVVFDFDGTLVDSNHIKIEAAREIAAGFDGGLPALGAVRADGGRQGRYALFTRFAERIGAEDPRETGAALAARYTRLCEERIAACPSCPGAPEVVAALRREGRRTYLNSGTPQTALLAILERRGWLDLFDDLRGLPTTKSENLCEMLLAAGARPQETVVVGDNDEDAQAAAAFGCRFVSFGCGREGFDLSSLQDLQSYLENP
jgi:phosphoglycolate phosphatase-like HAD superfamily hydrolase